MKKLSVSLFALCAIVLAVASAFTTRSVRFADGFFILDAPVTQTDWSSNYSTSYDFVSAYTSTSPADADDLNDATCTVNIPDGNDRVCAVQFTYSNGSNASLLDDGTSGGGLKDFPVSVPSVIKYKAIP